MIECSCNKITSAAFKSAIKANIEDVRRAPNIMAAVGIVYRYARDNNPDIVPKIPSCTTCFNGVAEHIQEAGFFKGQTLPPRTREPDCARRAQCDAPAAACRTLQAAE